MPRYVLQWLDEDVVIESLLALGAQMASARSWPSEVQEEKGMVAVAYEDFIRCLGQVDREAQAADITPLSLKVLYEFRLLLQQHARKDWLRLKNQPGFGSDCCWQGRCCSTGVRKTLVCDGVSHLKS